MTNTMNPPDEKTGADIAESIPGLVIETIVVVVGADSFPTAYMYCGRHDDGPHRWLGGLDDYEEVPEWKESRIIGVFFPPTAEAEDAGHQTDYPSWKAPV